MQAPHHRLDLPIRIRAPALCVAIIDRLTFSGTMIGTGTQSYGLAHTRSTAVSPPTALAVRVGRDCRRILTTVTAIVRAPSQAGVFR